MVDSHRLVLSPSDRGQVFLNEMRSFMRDHVLPAEEVYTRQRAAAAQPYDLPAVVEALKLEARRRGLWNLFLPDSEHGAGLSVLDYAYVAEESGRSHLLAPEATNCAAPDTGNMELLLMFGDEEQRERWLEPLLDGCIRSCFAMTEPAVASSDATNIATTLRRDGDGYRLSGRKWWISGAMDARCAVALVLCRSSDEGPRHARHSIVAVPMDADGVRVVRDMSVFGYTDQHGHAELAFDEVAVPAAWLVGDEGAGFTMAQARLGPGRIHHCMRAIGVASRALELMVDRVLDRTAFGRPLADQGVVREWIALSRIEIEQARLLVLKAAWMIDTVGARAARAEIAAIKVVAARTASAVVDRAIQAHGAAGFSQDLPLGEMYAYVRTMRMGDGPDEVHLRSVAKEELARSDRAG